MKTFVEPLDAHRQTSGQAQDSSASVEAL